MPGELLSNCYSGMIVVELKISEEGKVKEARIIRGVDPPLDKSILEFIVSMPIWEISKKSSSHTDYHALLPIHVQWLYGEGNF